MVKNVDQLLQEIENKEKRKKNSFLSILKSLLSLIVSLFIIMSFIVQAYRIPTGSMERTLRIGDMLLVNRFIYGFRTPDWIGIPFTEIGFSIPYYKFPQFKKVKQGDVVVFKAPANPDQYYVKRCVALSGQKVEFKDKILYVDDKPFDDFYQTLETDPAFPEGAPKSRHIRMEIFPSGVIIPEENIFEGRGNRDNFGPVIVPHDHYFMVGDNRDNSLDSRYWGFLPKENVVGKPVMVYFSYNSENDYGEKIENLWNRIKWERIGYFIQ